MPERSFFVHPSAYIDEPCEIGIGTKIWHFCHIMSDARIGEGCVLGQNVMVASGVIIGNNVKIQNNVAVYTGVELEDDVFCGPSCVFTNVINSLAQKSLAVTSSSAPWYGTVRPSALMLPSYAV